MGINRRRGEQFGWTLGWLGGFIWVAALAMQCGWQGQWWASASGLLLTAVAGGMIYYCAPWRHPLRPYWQLLLAPYTLFMLSIVWAIVAFGGWDALEFNHWSLLQCAPLLIPVLGVPARRTWADGEFPPAQMK